MGLLPPPTEWVINEAEILDIDPAWPAFPDFMRLLVCGDRAWTDYHFVQRLLVGIKGRVGMIIEGEAPGADSMARDVGISCGLYINRYPAEWSAYGQAAGPFRNFRMINHGKPHGVLALHDNLGDSTGTANMISQALAHKLPVAVASHNGPLWQVRTVFPQFVRLFCE